ncbi:MAG: type II toxin-antitoxin system Phd/YefM family antitoxin [Verrucomicrobia bacterium]|nr:type II toxin-antitoxin system Phd/YefM family antitoxin [Verrucomicrobiota bacterium]MBI3867148.1 type II toxin-antitoxin system Phd/YefM family antitoxin [Verrucomicrobiota bacterium]
MIRTEDIHSLSDFQRNVKAHVARLKKTGNPEVLTINGKAELVVISADAFQEFNDKLEQAEAVAGIRRGLAEAEAGHGRPVKQAVDAIRAKHRIPKTS